MTMTLTVIPQTASVLVSEISINKEAVARRR
jgi:hypothetical protein